MGRSGDRGTSTRGRRCSIRSPMRGGPADVQAQGLRAASQLVERLARSVDGAESHPPQSPAGR